MGRLVLLAAAAALAGCGTGSGSNGDADADGEADGDGDADGRVDADPDDGGDGGVEGCRPDLAPSGAFEALPGVPDLQLHPAALFDGEAIWLAYALPEESGSGGFDVWAVRLDCRGERLGEPFLLNTEPGRSDLEVELALGAGGVLAAWTSDAGGGTGMRIRYRLFTAAGEPLSGSDRALTSTRDGAPAPGNHMTPALAALPSGFLVAGMRANAESTAFECFGQRLDAAGALDGESWVGAPLEEGFRQADPSVAARSSGDAILAWQRDDNRFDPPDPQPSVVEWAAEGEASVQEGEGGAPALAATDTEPESIFLAMTIPDSRGTTIQLTDLAAPSAERPTLLLGESGRDDDGAFLALDPSGGAVAWLRHLSGYRNEVVVQGFRREGGALVVDAERVVVSDPPAWGLYGLGFTHVVGDTYFLAWVEGETSQTLRVHSRFVTVR